MNVVFTAVLLIIFFSGKDLGAASKTVTVKDEEGVEKESVIAKSQFRKS